MRNKKRRVRPAGESWDHSKSSRRLRFETLELRAMLAAASFQAISLQDQFDTFGSGSLPPDTMGAVGPNHFVESINSSFAIFNKSGSLVSHVALNTFFDTDGGGPIARNGTFDPRILYDHATGRWFATAMDRGQVSGKDNDVILAVSRTTDPTATWDKYVLDVSVPDSGGVTFFTDYSTLGVDRNGVYFGMRIFASSGNSFAKIAATPLDPLIAASPNLGTVFQWSNITDMYSTPQPAHNFDAISDSTAAIFVSSSSTAFANINYRRLTWSGGTATLGTTQVLTTASISSVVNAPASGSTTAINAGDQRLQMAVIRNEKLWTTRSIGLNSSGTSSNADRTGLEWFELDASSDTLSTVQTGRIYDSAASNPRFYYYPSINVSGQGHAVIGFSGSKSGEFVGAYYSRRLKTDAANTMSAPALIKAGEAAYNRLDGSNRNRWGDYSYTTVDPNDDMTPWTIQEYAESGSNIWGTWVQAVAAPAPSADNPNASANAGSTRASFNLSGTDFYDPGSGFANRLNVQLTGGSTNGISNVVVIYNSPTSATITYDVAADASPGKRSIVLTNPDGQSVTVTDGLTITSPNAAPSVTLANKVSSLPEDTDTANNVKVADIVVTDDGQGTNALQLTGPDAALFVIIGDALYLRAGTMLDFETLATLQVTVEIEDSSVGSDPDDSDSMAIDIGDVNEQPTGLNLSAGTIAENKAAGTEVGTFSSVDQDANQTFTYTLVTGEGSTDNASFTLTSGGLLKAAASFDFEGKSSYAIRVRTTDDGSLTFEKGFTITVTNVNEAPADIALSNNTVAENAAAGIVVGTISSSDPDVSQTFTYALVGTGNDNAQFEVDPDTGELTTAASFNFEADSSYAIRVRTTDVGGLTFEKDFTITVTNVNETPTNIATSKSSVAENEASDTTVGTLSTTDPDAGDSFTYALVTGSGDTDNGSFSLTGAGILKTAASFDFETKNSYSIRVKSTDAGGLATEKVLTISVTNVNEAPTNLALSNNNVAENTAIDSVVGVFTTTDPDASDSWTYALVAGAGDDDNDAFTVEASTGKLRTAVPFDVNVQSTYSIRARTTDNAGLSFEKTFTINIDNVNQVPTNITLTGGSVDENLASGATAGSFSAADPDSGDTFTWTLVAGSGDTDNARFALNQNSGQLTTADSFDFEAQSSYSIRVRVTDAGGLSREEVFTIGVNNVNEAPAGIALSNSLVDENLASATTVGTLSTTDPDAGDSFTYELIAGTGDNDNASFTLTSAGLLKTAESFNYEAKSSYSIRVKTTDAEGLATEKVFTVDVANVNESPTEITLSNGSIAENLASATTVGSLTTTDPDNSETFSYALVAGTGDDDNASFTLTSAGVLKTAASFDFEGKNAYSVRVKSTDAGGLAVEKVFTVTINDVNEAPQIALDQVVASLAEDADTSSTISVANIVITDDALGSRTLWLSGADAAKFTIVGSTVVLKSGAVLDYEKNPVLDVTININDAALGGSPDDSDSMSIAVSDANEAPTWIVPSSTKVAENQPAGATVGTLSTKDPDAGDTFTYQLVAGWGYTDNGSFTLSTGGILKTVASFDYEVKSSYSLRLRSTDAAGLSFERSLTITVTNLNDAPQVSLANELASLAEDADTSSPIKVADIVVSDDALGSSTYYLLGGQNDDASWFEIDAATGQLLLRAGAALNFETNPVLNVTIVIDDPALGSSWENSVTLALDVTDANDSPTIESASALESVTYYEQNSPVALIATGYVADEDGTLLPGAVLRATIAANAASGDRLLLSGTNVSVAPNGEVIFNDQVIGTLTSNGWNGNPLEVTFNSSATLWAVRQVLRNVRFQTPGDNPAEIARQVLLRVTDGAGGISEEKSVDVNVVAVNDAPRLDTSLSPVLRTIWEDAKSPQGTPLWELVQGAYTDVDNGALRGLAIVGAATNNGSWQYRLDGTTTWVTMGVISEESALLLPITPGTQVRFVPKANFNGQVWLVYRAWDRTEGQVGQQLDLTGKYGGSHASSVERESASLTVQPINDRPRMLFAANIGYQLDKPAIVLAPYARLYDIDSPDFDGGRLRVHITTGASSANRLGLVGFTVDANRNVLRDGVIIGALNANGGIGTEDLIVTFNANATRTVVQDLLRAVTFKTVKGTIGIRDAVFSLTDGDGGTADDVTKTINVY